MAELRKTWVVAATAIPLLLAVAAPFTACREAPPPPAAVQPAAPAGRDPWQEARDRGVDFRAVGQEPGWFLEIDDQREMHLLYDYAEREARTPVPAPVASGGTVLYEAITGAQRLRVVIEERACQDGMSGEAFPRTVTVVIDGRELRGCGRSLTAP